MKENRFARKSKVALQALLLITLTMVSATSLAEGSDELFDKESDGSVNISKTYGQRFYIETLTYDGDYSYGYSKTYVKVPSGQTTLSVEFKIDQSTPFIPQNLILGRPGGSDYLKLNYGIYLIDQSTRNIIQTSKADINPFAGYPTETYQFPVKGGHSYEIRFFPNQKDKQTSIKTLIGFDVYFSSKEKDKGNLYSPYWLFNTDASSNLFSKDLAWSGSFYGLINNEDVVEFKLNDAKGVIYGIGAFLTGSAVKSIYKKSSKSTTNRFSAMEQDLVQTKQYIPLYTNPPSSFKKTPKSRNNHSPKKFSLTDITNQCANKNAILGNATIEDITFNVTPPSSTGYVSVECVNEKDPSFAFSTKVTQVVTAKPINIIYTPSSNQKPGKYICNAYHYKGEVNLIIEDAETVNGLRMYDYYDKAKSSEYVPLYMTWDDTGLCNGVVTSRCKTFYQGSNHQYELKTEGLGILSGQYNPGAPTGTPQVRSWGTYSYPTTRSNLSDPPGSPGNPGNNSLMVTSAYYGKSAPSNDSAELYFIENDKSDSDNDTLADIKEACEIGSNPYDLDSDNDGIPDKVECDLNGNIQSGYTRIGGCLDSDGDGVPDILDLDSDNDGIPDSIEAYDHNHDGQLTKGDIKPHSTTPMEPVDPSLASNDTNGDGIADGFESKQFSDLEDTDGDGIPNYRDVDSDGDGISDFLEAFDTNHDGQVTIQGDFNGTKTDRVNPTDHADASNMGMNPFLKGKIKNGVSSKFPDDADNDGVPNYLDVDSDNDGIKDRDEAYANPDGSGKRARDLKTLAATADTNHNGLDDQFEGKNAPSLANNDAAAKKPATADNVPDYLDTDSDGDHNDDFIEYYGKTAPAIPRGHITDKSPQNGLDDRYEKDVPVTQIPTTGGKLDYLNPDLPTSNPGGGNGGGNPTTGDDGDGIDKSVECGAGAKASAKANCDNDGDGVPNDQDADSDNDGILDKVECDLNGTKVSPYPRVGGCLDTDGDGTPDFLDDDSDNDNIPDFIEAFDQNHDGVVTENEIKGSTNTPVDPSAVDPKTGLNKAAKGNVTPNDYDADGVPDYQDIDSDDDGITDSVECKPMNGNLCSDNDKDNVPDYVDLDTDGDYIPDLIEGIVGKDGSMLSPRHQDLNGNGLDDAFDPTCDGKICQLNNNLPIDSDEAVVADSDNDQTPDFRDRDSDNDAILDNVEGYVNPKDGKPSNNVTIKNTDNNKDGLDDGLVGACSSVKTCLKKISSELSSKITNSPDNDSIPNYRDQDSDGDGMPDKFECGPNTTCRDSDGDKTPDYLDTNSDNDKTPDIKEGVIGRNGQPITQPSGLDENHNGIDDAFDTDCDSKTCPTSGKPDIALSNGFPSVLSGSHPDKDAYVDSNTDENKDCNDKIDHPSCGAINSSVDKDGDGIPDNVECGTSTLYKQCESIDTDKDGVPDYRDPDSDNDGIPDALECPSLSSSNKCPESTTHKGVPAYKDRETDTDGDGILDIDEAVVDKDGKPIDLRNGADIDGDGYIDLIPLDANGKAINADSDNDGVPNFKDIDSDDDGILDTIECEGGTSIQSPKKCRNTDKKYAADGAPVTGDDYPDYLDKDSDGDGLTDQTEAGLGDRKLNNDQNTAQNQGLDSTFKNNGSPVISDASKLPNTDAELAKDPKNKTTGDSLPDVIDVDSDNDTIPDSVEAYSDNGQPVKRSGVVDTTPAHRGVDTGVTSAPKTITDAPADSDNDSTPDYQDLDSDNDGKTDKEVAYKPVIDDPFVDNNNDGLDDRIETPNAPVLATTPAQNGQPGQPLFRQNGIEQLSGFGIVAGGCSTVPNDTPSALPILGLLAGLIGWIRRRFHK